MSLTLHVGLLSGKTATVKANSDEDGEAITLRVQTPLGVRKGRSVDSSGSVLAAGVSTTQTN